MLRIKFLVSLCLLLGLSVFRVFWSPNQPGKTVITPVESAVASPHLGGAVTGTTVPAPAKCRAVYIQRGGEWETRFVGQLMENAVCRMDVFHRQAPIVPKDCTVIVWHDHDGTVSPDALSSLVSSRKSGPRVLVHLSDEFRRTVDRLHALYSRFTIVLRQYPLKESASDLYVGRRIIQIPLGYNGAMFNTLPRSMGKLASERKQSWAFQGAIEKTDRREMHAQFSQTLGPLGNNSYHEAVFVPIGRGWANLDCFRIYESLASGAIPVIVCSQSECEKAFGWLGRDASLPKPQLPPWIFAQTWSEAANKCKGLWSSKKSGLDEIQHQNFQWWIEIIKMMTSIIGNH